VLFRSPATEIADRERQELETLKQLEELAPLRTEYIRIRFANARELFDLFSSKSNGQGGGDDGNSTGSILSSRGQAIVDERTNSIILTDTEEKIAQFRALVEQIDIPIRQVQIEARLVVANTSFSEDLGIRWGGSALDSPGGDFIFIDGAGFGDTIVDLAAGSPAGAIEMGILTDNILLDLELTALESNGEGEIISQPKVITGDKQTATILRGQKIPYQKSDGLGGVTVEFQDAVLRLEVTPQITPDNNVIMDLVINQDSVAEFFQTSDGSAVPIIDVTELVTQVLVADGQTVVLGGVYETNETNSIVKVPFFGDIPYIGRLFRRTTTNSEKRELLIFITPRIQAETLVQ